MHARLLACTRRPEVLRGLAHVYMPQRCFSQSTFLLNQSKGAGAPAKDDNAKLEQLEKKLRTLLRRRPGRFWYTRGKKGDAKAVSKAVTEPSQPGTEKKGKKENTKAETELSQSGTEKKGKKAEPELSNAFKSEIEAVRKRIEGVSVQNEFLKNSLAKTNDRNKELVAELKMLFKQSTWPLHCKAALLKQAAKTLLVEAPSATASIPDMLLSNRDRYSEVGLSSPEQVDWISTQWRSLIDEQKVEVGPLSLVSIFVTLKYLEPQEKAVYHLLFQHFSGKPTMKWLRMSTTEEKGKVLVP